MNSCSQIIFKPGKKLTPEEIESINSSMFYQWHSFPISQYNRDIFALLKNSSDKIIAHAQLYPLNNLVFDSQEFSVLGIGSVLVSVPHQGHGKKLMQAIQKYLRENKFIGLGFTGPEIIEFFHKCGFEINCELIPRFFTYKEGVKVPYITDNLKCVFYFDPENILFSKILAHPNKEILIPEKPKL